MPSSSRESTKPARQPEGWESDDSKRQASSSYPASFRASSRASFRPLDHTQKAPKKPRRFPPRRADGGPMGAPDCAQNSADFGAAPSSLSRVTELCKRGGGARPCLPSLALTLRAGSAEEGGTGRTSTWSAKHFISGERQYGTQDGYCPIPPCFLLITLLPYYVGAGSSLLPTVAALPTPLVESEPRRPTTIGAATDWSYAYATHYGTKCAGLV